MRTRSQVPLQRKLDSIEEWNRKREEELKPVELSPDELEEVPAVPPPLPLMVADDMLNDDAPGWSIPTPRTTGYGTDKLFKK